MSSEQWARTTYAWFRQPASPCGRVARWTPPRPPSGSPPFERYEGALTSCAGSIWPSRPAKRSRSSGRSGAGKSTILKLINRLLDPAIRRGPASRAAARRPGIRSSCAAVSVTCCRRSGLFPHMSVAREHRRRAAAARLGRAPHRRASRRAARPGRAGPPPTTRSAGRTSCRAASVSASASPARSPPIRRSS